MDEVSCQAFLPFLRDLRARGIDPELLVRGTGIGLARVRSRRARVDWDVYRRIMANVAGQYTDEQLVDFGASFLRSPLVRGLAMLMRLLFSVRECYLWGYAPNGGGRHVFTCITASTEELGASRMRIRLMMLPGFEPCREVFLVSRGLMRHLPSIVGLPAADVSMTLVPGGAVYEVEYPSGGGALALLRRAATWPLAARTVARELKEAHEVLLERYHQLEQARAQIQRQATQLETAHSISQIIHRDLDLDRTLDAVVRSLTEVAGFTAAQVRISATLDDHDIVRLVSTGEPPAGGVAVSRAIASHGACIGEVRLWPAAEESADTCEPLIAYLMPVVSMAIDDALTFTALNDYRASLETRVAARTAELKQAHDEVAETVEKLQEAQAARERIFANINHEIRTPLSVITAAVATVRRRETERLAERSVAELAAVADSAGRLLGLVDNLLLLAAGGEGRLSLSRVEIDLVAAWRGYVATWAPVAAEAGLALACHAPAALRASVDEAALARIAGNLLSNAIKFTPAGGRVDVDLRARGEIVEIVVQDSGIGIEEPLRERIFARFEQGRTPVRAGASGSGIGLSIVQELVKAHGGMVAVDSGEAGTLFRISLPRQPPASLGEPRGGSRVSAPDLGRAARELRAHPAASEVMEPDSERLEATLLVAEDDPDLRRVIGTMLSGRYRVLLAADGETALSLAETHRPDLLVSDVGMPGMDGFELTRRFRELPGNRLAPVILLTAWGALQHRLCGFEAGAVDYVLKPFEPEELEARVASQLAVRDLALRLHESEKLASLGVLAAGLAHEIRNPANVVLNALRPLRAALPAESLQEGSSARALLDVVEECAERIASLARDLLGLARPSEGAAARASVSETVERARAVLEQQRPGVDLRQQLDFDGSVQCTAPLLLQVIINLLDNAADAAGARGWVRLETSRRGDAVVIDVSDSGTGVPLPLRARIFEPFFTTKPPGAGTGLGLTLSRMIAHQYGGSLDVVDLPGGRGSALRLRLRLPAEPLACREAAAVDLPTREDAMA